MKTWVNAEITELDIKATAFGPYHKEVCDSDKTAVTDENGNILGYELFYGDNVNGNS